MATDATLSVIIPVYNTEEYLERCLESVINQSYRHLEIIIINDGSTDNSLETIKKYCSLDTRCRYIDLPKNIGVGNARNSGIDISSGKYITFLDSDDWIDTNLYMELVKAIETDNSDIAVAGVKTEYNNAKTSCIRYQYKYNNLITNRFALKILTNEMSQDIYVSPIVNNKIYRSSIIKTSKTTVTAVTMVTFIMKYIISASASFDFWCDDSLQYCSPFRIKISLVTR